MILQIVTSALIIYSIFAAICFALPHKRDLDARSNALTAEQLAIIAPSSTSCAGATHPDECRTGAQALGPILTSFNTYAVNSAGAQAALLSTMAFESADFKFQKNYYPGNPGQGTRNMQSAAFNLKYAQSIPALAAQVSGAQSQGVNGVRDLLLANDDYDFGSAAWFLTTQCGPNVVTSLATGSMAGYMQYLDCIGTPMQEAREQYWLRATQILGVSSQ